MSCLGWSFLLVARLFILYPISFVVKKNFVAGNKEGEQKNLSYFKSSLKQFYKIWPEMKNFTFHFVLS